MIFRKKIKPADISVEIKIIGFMGGEYVNILGRVSVPGESSLRDLLKKATSAGMVKRPLSRRLASLPTEISVLVNGEPLPPESRRTVRLRNNDSVSFFAPSAGG